jgi:hypothetical protein
MTWCSGIAYIKIEEEGVMVMVFSATFKNISDISHYLKKDLFNPLIVKK